MNQYSNEVVRMNRDNHLEHDYNDEMCFVASNCRNFSKRRNVNSFSMSTYKSCENCSNFTSDYKCKLNQSDSILFRMNME